MSPVAAPPAGERCANCGQPLGGRFCSACGQEARDPARIPLRELFHDWLGDLFTFDARIFRTLGPLVRRPGLLTNEYLAGRRARYVPPLRLFVFVSLVMFLVLGLIGVEFSWKVTDDDEVLVASAEQRERLQEARAETGDGGERKPESRRAPPELLDDPREINRRLLERSPQVMFLLAPVFAFLVWLLHRRRQPYYVAHLIFSLHVHSFWFLVVTAAAIVDLPFADRQPGKLLLLGLLAPYLFLALRRVYPGRWWATLLRTLLLAVAQGFVYLAAMLGLLLLTVVWA